MPKNNKKASIREFFKVYGFNAIWGFGLGVVIVLVSLTFGGRGELGGDIRGEALGLHESGQPSQAANPSSERGEASQKGSLKETFDAESSSIYGDPLKNSRFSVLLVGMDNRPNETYLSNTDSLLVASVDQTNHRMTFLSIPRDTQVDLPGAGIQKINAIARVQKGLPATKKYIEGLIGFPIDGYISTNFNGFKSIIDGLGGITLTVEKNMHYDTGDSQDRYIDLKKGTQHLTGSQALQYARFRNDELADISRTVRQQAVMKAIFNEATELRNLPKIPFVLPKVYQAVQTDLSIGQLWSLASLLKESEGYQTVSQTLPGRFAVEQGISYWKVNLNLAQQDVSKLFLEGKTTSVFMEKQTKQQVNSGDEKSPKKQESNQTSNQELEQGSRQQNTSPENSSREIQFEVIKN
ncbi:LCP family protein [Desulfitobacterium sp.]|uniref:LCP family protein n=1 Tax=Desulfitobacterium sp. TaxID=49981 RepID=UPI002D07CE7C|nr:LCP family protein [Desulfitobacterium sp.]HVJ48385.1 LCP family protein [Desulfitobacterium sp.]